MKKLILSFVGLFAALSLSAQTTVTSTITGAATNSVLTSASKIYSLIIGNAGTNATKVRIFDAPSTSLRWTNAAYTVVSATSGNVTNTFTNSLGGYETNIYTSVLKFTTTTNAAATNLYSTVFDYTVPASTTISFTPTSPYQVLNGMLITNGTPGGNLTFTATYSK